MKVLYFYFSNRVFGFSSANIHIYEFMKGAQQLGEDVVPFTPLRKGELSDTKLSDFYLKINRYIPRCIKDLLAIVYNFSFYRKAFKKIANLKPDVLLIRNHPFMFFPILLKGRLKIPYVLEINTPLFIERVKEKNICFKGVMTIIEKKCWENADEIFTVSKSLKNILISNGIEGNKIHGIHNGVNLNLFDYQMSGKKIRDRYQLNNKFVIGFIGTFHLYHGIEMIIEEFHRVISVHKDIHLLLVGDGIGKQGCQNLVKELELDNYITFTGYVPYEEIPEHISAFDLAIMVDFTNYGSPIKLFEYMAMKKASLLPSCSPILEVIQHKKTGLIFEEKNMDSMIEQLKWAMENQNSLIEIAENAYKLVKEKFTWTINAKKVLGVCRKATKDSD